MLALAEESAIAFREKFLGQKMEVLWEQQKGGHWSGLTSNYIRVYTKSDKDLTNKITEVILGERLRDGVLGEK